MFNPLTKILGVSVQRRKPRDPVRKPLNKHLIVPQMSAKVRPLNTP